MEYFKTQSHSLHSPLCMFVHQVARLRERVKTLTRAVEELEFEKEAGFEKPLQKDVPPAPPSASSAPAAPPRPSPASLADDVLARQVEVAVISGARGANALIPPGPVPTLDAQVQTDPVVIGGRGQAQTQVQQGTPQLQPETVKPSPSQQPRPGGGPKAIEFTVPTVPVTDTRPSSKGPEERLKSPSPAVVASPTALKSMRATSVSPLSAVSGEGGGEEDVSVRDYDGVDIGRVSSSVGDVSRPSSRLPLQSFGAVGAGAGGLSSAAEADSSMMGQSQDPDDPNTVTDTPTGTAAGAGPGSVPASSKGSPGKPSQSRSKSPLKPPAEDDAIGLGYTADDKVSMYPCVISISVFSSDATLIAALCLSIVVILSCISTPF